MMQARQLQVCAVSTEPVKHVLKLKNAPGSFSLQLPRSASKYSSACVFVVDTSGSLDWAMLCHDANCSFAICQGCYLTGLLQD